MILLTININGQEFYYYYYCYFYPTLHFCSYYCSKELKITIVLSAAQLCLLCCKVLSEQITAAFQLSNRFVETGFLFDSVKPLWVICIMINSGGRPRGGIKYCLLSMAQNGSCLQGKVTHNCQFRII